MVGVRLPFSSAHRVENLLFLLHVERSQFQTHPRGRALRLVIRFKVLPLPGGRTGRKLTLYGRESTSRPRAGVQGQSGGPCTTYTSERGLI